METKKVMLVEDEELILEGLKSIIDWESLSMEVAFTAANGEEALKILAENRADIIVTDISMPVMDGLAFMEALRKTDRRTRCVILTGYEEFDYAKRAIQLDVEDYILKPINEEQLEEVLISAAGRLEEMDRLESTGAEGSAGWLKLLRGKLSAAETEEYLSLLPPLKENDTVYPALMKLALETMKGCGIPDILAELKEEKRVRVIYLSPDLLFLLYYAGGEGDGPRPCGGKAFWEDLQNRLEGALGVGTFISAGFGIHSYGELISSYETARKLQKYRLVEGYGGIITPEQIKDRRSRDIDVDEERLRRLLLKRDRDGAAGCLEDLFLSVVDREASVEDIYQMSLRVAMLLQEIKREYQLMDQGGLLDLTGTVDTIYHAEDLAALKALFVQEAVGIIAGMEENNSRYTPVVKQIISEVRENFREDMSLKTLACKYHMNASYLGQLFQKEVGCSFARYVSGIKNEKAREMILNTNLKMNEIAREIGYTDLSYFYRKFKQCYGVSPAALREMKKY